MHVYPSYPARRGRARAPSGTCRTRQPVVACRVCALLDPVTACDACIDQAEALFRTGKDIAAIGKLLAVNEKRAVYLVVIAQDRRAREALVVDVVATEGLRVLVAAATGFTRWAERLSPADLHAAKIPAEMVGRLSERLRARPVTTGEIVHAAGYSSLVTLKRDLGILKQPARSNADAPVYSDTLDVDNAGRIVRALGVSPSEVAWL